MVTFRTALAGACLALALLTAAGCAQLDEAMNSRDIDCVNVSDDMCTRLADHIVSLWDPANVAEAGPIVRVVVQAIDCDRVQKNLAMVRCWEVGASAAVRADGTGGEGIGAPYSQRVDGTLFHGEEVIGIVPVE